jgi:hypothetical protein
MEILTTLTKDLMCLLCCKILPQIFDKASKKTLTVHGIAYGVIYCCVCHVRIAANCWKKEIVWSLDHQTSHSV